VHYFDAFSTPQRLRGDALGTLRLIGVSTSSAPRSNRIAIWLDFGCLSRQDQELKDSSPQADDKTADAFEAVQKK
jgi:hypothetical protein